MPWAKSDTSESEKIKEFHYCSMLTLGVTALDAEQRPSLLGCKESFEVQRKFI